jgi:hypothetical protein
VGKVEPLAGAYRLFDRSAGFEGQQRGVTDENRGVCLLEHRDWVSACGDKGGVCVEKFAEEDLGVGERAA